MNLEEYKEVFLGYLNEKIKSKDPVNLYNPIKYILEIGGKRLRPILALMICDLFGEDSKKAMDVALAIEVFHNFTLVHDDIMDSAPIRRGKETVHKKWDENTGILSGDAMLIIAYQCVESYEPELFKKLMLLFSKTALEVCEGQQWDVDFETRNDVSIEEYIKMITYKTSVLIGAAMQMGAMIANVSEKEEKAIYNFGLNLGLAFQLQDDYLDTFGDVETFGKKIGGDIIENKKTFLYLTALNVCEPKERRELFNLYNSDDLNNKKVEKVTSIFKKNKVDVLIKKEIENYTEKSLKVLNQLSISEQKKSVLKEFGLSLMKRTI
ncbi:polyprenyl synthetase family protein [Lutibacter sp. TH_r2]|uniref:polyprenyl synthetase family protein n=1 Tax=Lutibacter sp. TH_r2 TaxID=3082083 RepID=UPI002952AC47|nr:polyprenyl synthetase family protein [Lutibacter sp. TH_r2]MDV7186188.1 polyprenyl synthetase family protein [Lutibacter sp. TH_r2]